MEKNEEFNWSDVFHNITDAISISDKSMNLLAINKAFAQLYNVPTGTPTGINILHIFPTYKDTVFFEAFNHTVETGQSVTRVGYAENIQKWVASRTAKYGKDKYITTSHLLDAGFNEIGYMTNYDSLTSLKNRFAFEKDINTLTEKRESFGLTILDVKRFRYLNESFGLEAGDMSLMEISARMKNVDPNVNQVYRINADQFAIITNLRKTACLTQVKNFFACFAKPFNINGEDHILDICVGFYFANGIGETTSNVIGNAESALVEAKKTKHTYCEFPHNQNNNKSKMSIAKELKKALKNDEFVLHYQAQVDTVTKKICGAEALIRWNHPEKGLVLPSYFLTVAEEYELMLEIDKMVMRQAFLDVIHFAKNGITFPISINLSAQTICNLNTISFVNQLLKKMAFTPNLITIEITESSLMTDIETSKNVINHLKSCGFKTAIDDFGTGYSSMGYLVRYPTDYLKIDRSFITNIHLDKSLQTIVHNITKMSHSLGIAIVVEGVELVEEANMLSQFECDIIQGYLFGRPESKETLINRIKQFGISTLKFSLN